MTMLSQTVLPVGHYRSYLVRFWQSNADGSWRASAQCVQTGSTMLFGDVESLFAFLHTEIVGSPRNDAANKPSLPVDQG